MLRSVGPFVAAMGVICCLTAAVYLPLYDNLAVPWAGGRLGALMKFGGARSRHIGVGVVACITIGTFLGPPVWRAPTDSRHREAGEFIQRETSGGDLVVIPYIMDSTVGYYAGGWPAALARSLFDRGVDLRRLLFVAREGDPRFALGSYQLTTSFTTTADLGDRYRKIQLPAEAFDPLESYGRVGLHQPVLPLEIALNHQDLGSSADWSVYYESVHGGIQLTDWDSNHPGDSALLQIRSPSKATFVLHSKRRLAPPGHGLLLLIYTKSASTGGYASLYEVEAHGQGSPQALQMVKPLSQTIELDGGAESHRRFGEIYLIPVRPDREYGVYIYGQGEETQFFGGWAVYYQPFPDG